MLNSGKRLRRDKAFGQWRNGPPGGIWWASHIPGLFRLRDLRASFVVGIWMH